MVGLYAFYTRTQQSRAATANNPKPSWVKKPNEALQEPHKTSENHNPKPRNPNTPNPQP